MDAYRTLSGPASARLTRERSRFLAFVEPTTRDLVDARLLALRRQYHDATHLCHAYCCRVDSGIVSASDDAGEPRGSAGLPILQQLVAARLADVLAVVVRYFGGAKLGLGGLVRAYGDVTAAALKQADVVERQIEMTLHVCFPYEATAAVMRSVHRHGARVLSIRYDTQGEIVVALPPSRIALFSGAVHEETGARATVARSL